MHRKMLWAVLLLSAMLFVPFTRGLAHGEPELSVEPSTAPAGSEITITGTEMEDGEVFALTLEGMFDSFNLGEVNVSGEGFTIVVIIPAEASPGLYTLQATSEEGESVSVEVTILASSTEMDSSQAVEAAQPSAEKMALERPRTAGNWALAGVIILIGGLGGIWLVRKNS